MAARVVTLAFSGVDAVRVEVEVQFTGGEKAFMLVGLGDKAVAESRERVRAAFTGLGLALPAKRIIANLAPADLPKVGSHYDLPIALAVMAGMGIIPADALEGWAAVGELSLDGRIMPVAGALPAAVAAGGMGLGLICPEACRLVSCLPDILAVRFQRGTPATILVWPGESFQLTRYGFLGERRGHRTKLTSCSGRRSGCRPRHRAICEEAAPARPSGRGQREELTRLRRSEGLLPAMRSNDVERTSARSPSRRLARPPHHLFVS